MAKLAQNFAKYLIHARLYTKGVVERPDVIGAIFGQTEGLLGADLDLRADTFQCFTDRWFVYSGT